MNQKILKILKESLRYQLNNNSRIRQENLFLKENPTFAEKRKMIILVERLLNLSEYREEQINKII